jgi:hypothetical protein
MSTPIVVDRIEGTRAVLVVGDEQLDVPASMLPPGTQEGDVVVFQKGDASALRDAAAARQARLAATSNLPDEIDL